MRMQRWDGLYYFRSSRMAPKERRRGKKEIHRDNGDTLRFYLKFSLVGSVVQISHLLFFFFIRNAASLWDVLFLVFGVCVQLVCQWMLHRLAAPHLGPQGELLDAGADLSDNYIAEYVIDFIILTAFLQGISMLSNLFWILWLLVPGFIFYKFWKALIWPWLSSGPSTLAGGEESKRQRTKVKYMRR